MSIAFFVYSRVTESSFLIPVESQKDIYSLLTPPTCTLEQRNFFLVPKEIKQHLKMQVSSFFVTFSLLNMYYKKHVNM